MTRPRPRPPASGDAEGREPGVRHPSAVTDQPGPAASPVPTRTPGERRMPKRRPQPTASRPVTTTRRADTSDDPPFTARQIGLEDQARAFWRYVCGPAVGALLALSLFGIGPAWAALLGYGSPGTWTATTTTCGPKSCTTQGTFVSDNGKDVRTGISMDTKTAAAPGTRFRALDSGASGGVFPPGGGYAWIGSTLAVAATGPLFALWAWKVPIAAIKRRRRRNSSAPESAPASSSPPTTQPPPQTATANPSRTSTSSSTSTRARRARRRRTSR